MSQLALAPRVLVSRRIESERGRRTWGWRSGGMRDDGGMIASPFCGLARRGQINVEVTFYRWLIDSFNNKMIKRKSAEMYF
jgi:hypothetical protein